ncbi:MAG: class I SAM-dependent methyltransferase [Gammaproteobacteria bacterium]
MNLLSRFETRRRFLRGMEDSDWLAGMVDRWFQSPQGVAVFQAEKALLAPMLERLFGYHILQVSCGYGNSLIEDSPVGHKIKFAPNFRPGIRGAVADNEELPLPSDSIDIVVIHHALDFTDDSHRLLREATRVLRPGGHMFIVGFNPFSSWGLWKLFKRKINIPWRGRFISRRRLSDWLSLLDLHIDRVNGGLHFPPLRFKQLLARAQRWEALGKKLRSPFGGMYCIHCLKQVAPITPILPRWRPLRTRASVIPVTENVRARIH